MLNLTAEQVGLPPLDAHALSRWRARALAALLVSEAYAHAPRLVGDGHEMLIPSGPRDRALDILTKWADSLSLRARLPEAVLRADHVANLGTLVGDAALKNGPFLSRAAEYAVFTNTCTRLAQKKGKDLLTTIAGLHGYLVAHAGGFWGDGCQHPQAMPWGELVRLSAAARTLLEAVPSSSWASPAEAITWFTGSGWRVDRAGEDILRNLGKPVPELLPVVTALREAYRARWESYLIQWSETWTAAGCPVPKVSSAGEWMKGVLQQQRATAILVLDALRYDLGAALADEINTMEGAMRASVTPGRAPLPLITPLGMVLALPIPESDLVAELHNGKWQVHHGDNLANLSEAAERRAWWHAQGGVAEDAMVSVADVLAGHVPTPEQGRTRLILYDDAIDKLGHDDELEGMGASTVTERYITVIQQLRDAGWLRILVTTDHGYIHWYGGTETSTPLPAPNPAYKSRRALAYPLDVVFNGPQGLAPGGRYRVAVPRGAASFQTYGGLGYFHGGASLQEWIIPCLQIEWPVKAQPVGVHIEPLRGVLSLRPRITLAIVRSSLLIEDALPRPVEVLVRDAAQNTILFRSAVRQVTPGEQQASVELKPSAGVTAERGTSVRIEVRDAHTEEVLDSATTTLLVALDDW